jgi:hypothetical protein
MITREMFDLLDDSQKRKMLLVEETFLKVLASVGRTDLEAITDIEGVVNGFYQRILKREI